MGPKTRFCSQKADLALPASMGSVSAQENKLVISPVNLILGHTLWLGRRGEISARGKLGQNKGTEGPTL